MGKEGEKRLVELGSNQLGVVTAKDIAACGVPRSLLFARLETREWIRLHRGVFKIASSKANLAELEIAAILAAGDGAVLSHSSAAARLGLKVPPDRLVHVTIPFLRRAPRLDGVQVWRSRDLIGSHVTRQGALRLTHLARTMTDLASVLEDKWLRAAFDSALRQRRANLGWISQVLSECGNGHRGAARLRALVAEYRAGDEVPDSVLESLALQLARATGREPRLHWNVVEVERWLGEVDLAWPDVKLCVQIDGWMWHSSREAFEEDRARDRALQRVGWMVLRWTSKQVQSDPESLVAELVGIYQSRAASRQRKRGADRVPTGAPTRPTH